MKWCLLLAAARLFVSRLGWEFESGSICTVFPTNSVLLLQWFSDLVVISTFSSSWIHSELVACLITRAREAICQCHIFTVQGAVVHDIISLELEDARHNVSVKWFYFIQPLPSQPQVNACPRSFLALIMPAVLLALQVSKFSFRGNLY